MSAQPPSSTLDSEAVPTTAELQGRTYKRGEKVRLLEDIPGYPAGSTGKISVANGLTWKRYWVRFADGNAVGHVGHDLLVRAKEYEKFLVARDREVIEAEKAAELAASGAAADSDAGGGSDTAGPGAGIEINGVFIEQSWLDKSAAARARLGG
mgnify:FL=1|jgi:hypothetical protein